MEEGFLVDKGHSDAIGTQDWVEGKPVRSLWFGVKTKGKEKHPVKAFRCERCGYLEMYATDD